MPTNHRGVGVRLALPLVLAAAGSAPAQLYGLGAGTTASALSGDGSVVAGAMGSGYFRWSIAGGMQTLPLAVGSTIQSLSGDGSVVFGRGTGGGGFRYDGSTTTLYPHALPVAMSRDGLVMTGLDQFGGTAVRWTTADPTPVALALGSMSIPGAIDADGGVIVGQALSGQTVQLMRWSMAGGAEFFPPPSPYVVATGTAVTADGSVVCGQVEFAGGTISTAFRRGPSGMYEVLPVLGGNSRATVSGVTDDGATIVGTCLTVGAVWTGGSVSAVGPYLNARGLSTAGWTFSSVIGISGDGRVLAGNGVFNGQSEAWVAVIPAPPAGLVIATALMGVGRRRRSGRYLAF